MRTGAGRDSTNPEVESRVQSPAMHLSASRPGVTRWVPPCVWCEPLDRENFLTSARELPSVAFRPHRRGKGKGRQRGSQGEQAQRASRAQWVSGLTEHVFSVMITARRVNSMVRSDPAPATARSLMTRYRWTDRVAWERLTGLQRTNGSPAPREDYSEAAYATLRLFRRRGLVPSAQDGRKPPVQDLLTRVAAHRPYSSRRSPQELHTASRLRGKNNPSSKLQPRSARALPRKSALIP